MNLSCSGGGLPESGCLFFKVTAMGQNQQNSGYVTNGRNTLKFFSLYITGLFSLILHFTAKFNCTVSGTRYDFIEECNNITTGITADTIPEMTTASVVSTLYTTTDDIEGQIMIIDFDFVYVLAGLGGGILILILLVVAVCTCFCIRLAKRKRQTFTFTAAPSHNVYSMEDVEQPHGK